MSQESEAPEASDAPEARDLHAVSLVLAAEMLALLAHIRASQRQVALQLRGCGDQLAARNLPEARRLFARASATYEQVRAHRLAAIRAVTEQATRYPALAAALAASPWWPLMPLPDLPTFEALVREHRAKAGD
jgi:hypothetical protein